MTTRFNNAFTAFPTKSVIATNSYVSNPFPPGNVWELYPKFIFQVDVTAATQSAAQAAWQTFVDDCRDGLRTLINQLTGTTVTLIHIHQADGSTVEVAF